MTGLTLTTVLAVLGVAAVSYLLGCCNSAIIISKYVLKDDVREHGSGNAGLTNFYRVYGVKNVVWVILLDVLKAVLSCLIGGGVLGTLCGWEVLGKYIAGIFCLLGHMFPCMFEFKGGKGILSGGVVAIMIDWRIALAVWGVFLVLVVISRMVSLGSVGAAITFPISTWFVYQDWLLLVLAAGIGLLVCWRHLGNVQRMIRGEESKLEFHKDGEREDKQ
ncbi:MAG: glycerol-3-phosphate acyltransferase [Clostridiales bacterium]|nr:glycerol-3-phosphate acyltransferase [Clostridiales bacterium]